MGREICHAAALLVALGMPLSAQARRPPVAPMVYLGSPTEERARMLQLVSDTNVVAFMLRSASSLTPALPRDSSRRLAVAAVLPDLLLTDNSDIAYSLNDGALWAGRGTSLRIRGGVRLERDRVRVILLPEFIHSANLDYDFPDPAVTPQPPAWRSPYSSPWHAGSQSIDLPLRFGEAPITRLVPGQSSVTVDAGLLSAGVATENEWWGPAMRNALLLSNNAAGIPRAFLRTTRPVSTRFGTFDGRWLAGWLTESPFFDTVSTNDTRSVAMMAVTWRPPHTSVTLGAARSVFAPASGPANALTHVLDVFRDVGHPDAWPYADATMAPGPDQLLSLSFRWVLPEDGFETYGEWGRADFPVSPRDALVQPNHSQAYTLGLQWLGQPFVRDVRLRAQAEATYLEQSTTYRTRLIGSWYTSRAVEQGYTNEGQVIGAAIGPGSSSQFIALDAVASRWQGGAYVTRVRWLEDARSQQSPYPAASPGEHGNCEHDVSLLPGARMMVRTPFGVYTADYSSGWRLNVFFEHQSPCFRPRVARDVRNRSLTLSVTPFSW